jgi:hypothetical protein
MRRNSLLSIVALAAVLTVSGGCVSVTTQSGEKPRVVPTSIDATGGRDVTAELNNFIASVPNKSKIVFQPNGRYRIEDRVTVRGKSDLEIDGNGATLFATTLGYKTRYHFRVESSQRIYVHDLNVRGPNTAGGFDGDFSLDREHQHAFDVRSSQGVVLDHVTGSAVWGDLVYIGKMDSQPWSDGVLVQNSTFSKNGRQGMTFIGARNVMVRNNTMTDLRRSTFDFEPYGPSEGASDITIENNKISHGRLMFVAATAKRPVENITIRNNRLSGEALQFLVNNLTLTPWKGWKVYGNTSDLRFSAPHGSVMRFTRVSDLSATGNTQPFKGTDMVMANLNYTCGYHVSDNVIPGAVAQYRVQNAC